MRKPLLLIALLTATTLAASAQDARLGPDCDLTATVGAKTTQGFSTFDKDLRQALQAENIAALALLVDFPLRVNADHGTYYISNAAALQSQFSTVFPASIRSAIIQQKPSEVFCTGDGIGYGNGDIYVYPEKFGYAVTVVNLPPSDQPVTHDRIGFVCRTKEFRILVDSPEKGKWRYRSWTAGRSVLAPPSLTLNDGSHSVEGTDGCDYDLWTFKSGSTTYSANTLGCFPDSNQPPQGARGQLEVDSHGKSLFWDWCY
jgi:hypothetical protein